MSYSSTTAQLSDDDIALGNGRVQETPVEQPAGETPAGETPTAETPAAEAPAEGKPKSKVSWEDRRIATLTRRLNEESRRAALAEQREAQILAAAQKALNPDGQAAEPVAPAAPTPEQFNAAVAAAAAKQQFDNDCTVIYNSGVDELPGFTDRLTNFRAIGGMSQPLIEAVMESASSDIPPHKILFELGGDMDEAARIAELPPVKMAAAVAKFAMGLKAETKQVTKAPPPITTIPQGTPAPKEKDPEKMTPQEWRAWREAQIAARKAARR